MVKIVSGWSNRGGSTFAFINLTNELNKAGYDTTFYGPHEWHLDKCKSALMTELKINKDDTLIFHFLPSSNSQPVKSQNLLVFSLLFCVKRPFSNRWK